MRTESKFKKPSKIDTQEFEMLYNAGLSPHDIAVQLGLERTVVSAWMRQHGYQRFCPDHQKIARQMYDDGATDFEISQRLHSTVSAVSIWRENNKLKKKSRVAMLRAKMERETVDKHDR